jgi:hypothetical protein
MHSRIYIAILALALLLLVLLVFASPSVDLPSTALRAQRAAVLVFLAIALVQHRVRFRLPDALPSSSGLLSGVPRNPSSGRLSLTCALLC